MSYMKECYRGIIRRCYDSHHKSHKNYGARGISVCPSWLESFEKFCSDMGERPSKKHSIDRIDNDGDYCPSNCKWSTPAEQANNRRSTVYITAFGETKTFSEFSNEYGIPTSTLFNRIIKFGWDAETALIKEPQGVVHINGIAKRIGEWCKDAGISTNTYKNRVSMGWDKQKALTTPPKFKGKNGRN